MSTQHEAGQRIEPASAGASEAYIVVGVDGSDESSAALAWAAEEARLRHVALTVVHAWTLPVLGYAAYVPVNAFTDADKSAAADLDAQVAKVLGPDPEVPVTLKVVEGPPAQAIIEAAKHALLVVVGSRGRGGFAGLLLGSVSAQVVHYAHCPTTVVRG